MPANKKLSVKDQYRINPKKEYYIVIEESRSSLRNDKSFLIAVKVKTEKGECWIHREVLERLFDFEDNKHGKEEIY